MIHPWTQALLQKGFSFDEAEAIATDLMNKLLVVTRVVVALGWLAWLVIVINGFWG